METGDNMAAAQWFVNNEIIPLVQLQAWEVNEGAVWEVKWRGGRLLCDHLLSAVGELV